MRITGSWIAIPTPFNSDDKINFDVFKKLIDFHKKYGTDGLLVLGSAGEASMLTKIEKQETIEFVSKYAKGKIPVFVGTTASNTSETIAMTKFAKQCGSDGALMVVPGYIRPPQEAIYDFFKAVATAVDIPIAVYNNPTRVGVNILPETAIRLAKIPNVVAIKQAYPEVSHLIEIKKALGDNIDILPCDAPPYSIILPCLAIGGSGVTNITGNLAPAEFALLSKPWKNFNDVIKSRELVFKYYDLMKICYSVTNPVVIKAGLNLLGFSVGKPRLPLQELVGNKLEGLKEEMERLDLFTKYLVN